MPDERRIRHRSGPNSRRGSRRSADLTTHTQQKGKKTEDREVAEAKRKKPTTHRQEQDMLVTPEMAERWLKLNSASNRKLQKKLVNNYAQLMANGRWEVRANSPISFTQSGTLTNGQHRLNAIVQSGETVVVRVSWRESVQ